MAKGANPEVLQLKIVLDEITPPIWRRVLVPMGFTLAKLHDVIQIAFGWEDSHLHLFKIHGRDYGPRDSDGDEETHSERINFAKLDLKAKTKFAYEYDFGDSWVHVITVEKVLVPKEPLTVPICLEGKRGCPPEDCGGAWGYQELLEALGDSEHPSHEEFKEWLDADWDSEAFHLDRVNAALEETFMPKKMAIANKHVKALFS